MENPGWEPLFASPQHLQPPSPPPARTRAVLAGNRYKLCGTGSALPAPETPTSPDTVGRVPALLRPGTSSSSFPKSQLGDPSQYIIYSKI